MGNMFGYCKHNEEQIIDIGTDAPTPSKLGSKMGSPMDETPQNNIHETSGRRRREEDKVSPKSSIQTSESPQQNITEKTLNIE